MSDTETKYRTVTLTGRPPVRINEAHWPLVARAEVNDVRNGIDSDANRRSKMFVRQHTDGRRLVYGVYVTHFQGERDIKAGELLSAGQDIAMAAARVAETLGYQADELAHELLADMPAEDLE